jgi:hypothetical protein
MSNIESNNSFEAFKSNIDLSNDQDFVMEQILDSVNSTPIGQVLKRIASMPEVRQEKVLDVRRQLSEGNYELTDRLASAMDKVLEDVLS